jgi:WXG100 family type VII secretion target
VNGFRADLDRLSDLVERMISFETCAEALAADLDAQARRLHGEWSGAAASAHLAAHRAWLDGAVRMRTALGELQSAVSTASGNYCAAAAANSRMWG